MPRYLPTLPETLKNKDTDSANTSVSADNTSQQWPSAQTPR